jgi:hypothetical protein
MHFWNVPLDLLSDTEGTVIDNCVLLFNQIGVRSLPAPGSNPPWVTISNCHISSFQRGVQLRGRSQCFIHHNLIYKRPESSSAFVGIELARESTQGAECQGSFVDHNFIDIIEGSSGGADGIVVDSDFCHIQNNTTDGCTTSVWLKTNSSQCVVMGNLRKGGSNTVVNQGSNNYVPTGSNFP